MSRLLGIISLARRVYGHGAMLDLSDRHTELNPVYFPARLAQAKDLTQLLPNIRDILREFDQDRHDIASRSTKKASEKLL
jgi:hypothetical protein